MPDLKPCPFCGGEPKFWNARSHAIAEVYCVNHRYHIGVYGDTDDEAIHAWNRRAGEDR